MICITSEGDLLHQRVTNERGARLRTRSAHNIEQARWQPASDRVEKLCNAKNTWKKSTR